MKRTTVDRIKKLRKLGIYEENQTTDTEEFRHWFGDSKVVDRNGNPLLVYHGSVNKGFDSFDISSAGVRPRTGPTGAYFTSDAGQASNYTRYPRRLGDKTKRLEPGQFISAYLRIENPLDITNSIKKHLRKTKSFSEAKALALQELTSEHDGVIFWGNSYNSDEFIVFDPNQIKSATRNNGQFSLSSNNIYESLDSNPQGNLVMPYKLLENAVTSYFKADYYKVERTGNNYRIWISEFSKYFEALGIVMSLDGATDVKDIEENNRFGISFSYPSEFPSTSPTNVVDASPHTPNIKVGVNESVEGSFDSFEDWSDSLVTKYGSDVDYVSDDPNSTTMRAVLNGKTVGVFVDPEDGLGKGQGIICEAEISEDGKVIVYPPRTGNNQSEQWMATSWLSGKEGQSVGYGKSRQAAIDDLDSIIKKDSTTVLPSSSPENFDHSGVDWTRKEKSEDPTVDELKDLVRAKFPGKTLRFVGSNLDIDVIDADKDIAYGFIDTKLGEFIPFDNETVSESQTINSGNEGQGFHGAIYNDYRIRTFGSGNDVPSDKQDQVIDLCDEVFSRVANELLELGHFSDPLDARDFLDSSVGRHLGDEMGYSGSVKDVPWLPKSVYQYKKAIKRSGMTREGTIGYEVPSDNSLLNHGKSGRVFSLNRKTSKRVNPPRANNESEDTLEHGDVVLAWNNDYYIVDLKHGLGSTAEKPWIDSLTNPGYGFYSDADDLTLVAKNDDEVEVLRYAIMQVLKRDLGNGDFSDFSNDQAGVVYDHFGDFQKSYKYILQHSVSDYENDNPGNSLNSAV